MDDTSKNPSNQANPELEPPQEILPVNPEPVKAYGFKDNRIWGHLDQFSLILKTQVEQKERSQQTYEAYQKAFRQFSRWGKAHGYPPVTPEVIRQYKEFLIRKELMPATINLYLVAIRVFFDYYLKLRMVPYNPVALVKGVKRKQGYHAKDALTIDEAKRLLASVSPSDRRSVPALKELRDFAMIYLMLKTGLREIEVVRAKVGDLKTYQGEKVLFVLGKGDLEKNKFVVVASEVYNSLQDYLHARKFSKPEDPLFAKLVPPTKSGRSLSLGTWSVRMIISKYLEKAGIRTKENPRPEITVHSIRHTTANLALDGDAPLVQVQEMMRHAKIETTMIYIKKWNRVKKAAELHIKQI